jgi:transposase InsO family protein
MATLRRRDIEVRYVRGDGELIVTTLGEVDAESVARGRPVRRASSHAGQRHYSGLFWSATTGGHVVDESRLELDRLLLADFDPDVEWLATQPMWLSGADGAKTRRHVPDLLTRLRGGGYLVTDVKPAEFAARPEVDSRWDAACIRVLDELTLDSTPTMNAVIARVARELDAAFGADVVPLPAKTTAYSRLNQLAKGRYSFGSAKGRRSVVERPRGVFGRLRPMRPGEYVVLDTTPLDVFAMEPVTLRWVPVELTVAMDLFTRCILGLRLTPVSTKSQDVANVLFQTVTVQPSSGNPLKP